MFNAKTYWNERLKKQYDLNGVGDITLGLSYNKWSYKVTRNVLNRLLKKHLHNFKNPELLDIGSGTGFIVEILSQFSGNVTGVDITSVAVAELKRRFHSLQFYETDISTDVLPIAESSVACCTAASVLYHIVHDEGLEKALKEIHRVLKPGGIFIFSDYFLHNKNFAIIHQKCRTLTEYEALLKKTGFEIYNRVPNYVLMNDPLDATGKFYPRVWKLFNLLSARAFFRTILWPLVYPFEMILTSVLKESPTQEFMICKAVK